MLSEFYRQLSDGDVEAIRQLFTGPVSISAPSVDGIVGNAELEAFVAAEHAWLGEWCAQYWILREMSVGDRHALEILVHGRRGEERLELPVLIIAQCAAGRCAWLRIYHSTWPLTGHHHPRPPIDMPMAIGKKPAVIERYFAGLASGDVDNVLACYAPHGSLREPSGSAYLHAGRDALRAFYEAAFAEPGGVALAHMSTLFDGACFVVEYVCDRWGRHAFAPIAGAAVYDLTEGADAIAAVRIYDDVAPPNAA